VILIEVSFKLFDLSFQLSPLDHIQNDISRFFFIRVHFFSLACIFQRFAGEKTQIQEKNTQLNTISLHLLTQSDTLSPFTATLQKI
jgi:hypothetical protein